jgi:hypothetical protein
VRSQLQDFLAKQLCELSKPAESLLISFCQTITFIGYHHCWLLLSSSTDRKISISGNYVIAYAFFVVKAKILPHRDTNKRI